MKARLVRPHTTACVIQNNKPSSICQQLRHANNCRKHQNAHVHISESAFTVIFMSDNVPFHQIGSVLRFHPGKCESSTVSFGTDDDAITLHNRCFASDCVLRRRGST